ncbi:methyltransferase family protein [Pseudonocardia endophytica]|uniref:Methyltransferase family protein n=2 Tax=Pseudonocardia endophytica TaxID=401976 RepID=A0A4R1HXC3_PSEEN|nr:methyltransferase family protein [Pseudonocardia endophytica]
MWKYAAVAAASRAFSLNSSTRWVYRRLGNVALTRMRVADGLPERYVDRARRLLAACETNRILRPGDAVLELGTGWVHWEALVLRLFHDVEITLYDVWDNRLFTAFRCYADQLDDHLDDLGEELGFDPARVRTAHERLGAARSARTFDELYDTLGMRYVVEPSGMLEELPESHYALVVSADVLEHVDAATLPAYLARTTALLRPGGWSLHQIDLVDHFHYFDPSCSPKHFYRYDTATWRRRWDSSVQYVNRVQRPEWLDLFEAAGLQLRREERVSEPMGDVPLAGAFRGLAQEDVDCLQTILLHRRPEPAVPHQGTSTENPAAATIAPASRH